MKLCPKSKCETLHTNKGRFCSKKCANSRGPWSDDHKQLLSLLAKQKPTGFAKERLGGKHMLNKHYSEIETRFCLTCFQPFVVLKSSNNVTCSPPCQNHGGLRKGAGRGKHGWYKGLWLDSTYELAYVIYCLDHDQTVIRNKRFWYYIDPLDGKTKKYYPDFLVNGKLVEIKGIINSLTQIKANAVTEPLLILTKKELQPIFQYVENKIGLKIGKLYQLYSGGPGGT